MPPSDWYFAGVGTCVRGGPEGDGPYTGLMSVVREPCENAGVQVLVTRARAAAQREIAFRKKRGDVCLTWMTGRGYERVSETAAPGTDLGFQATGNGLVPRRPFLSTERSFPTGAEIHTWPVATPACCAASVRIGPISTSRGARGSVLSPRTVAGARASRSPIPSEARR